MLAAVRVRGWVDITPAIKKTLELLGLDRVNHLALFDESAMPMLRKAESRITFGEIDAETLALLLEKRGRLPGRKKLDAHFLKDKKFRDFKEAAKALLEKKSTLEQLGIKRVFRLNPPSKGYERAGIKKGFKSGGALGYRASDINALLRRMI